LGNDKGLIRGHWDIKRIDTGFGYADDETTSVNMGMAIVTPSQEVIDLLFSDESVQKRKRLDREFAT